MRLIAASATLWELRNEEKALLAENFLASALGHLPKGCARPLWT